MPKNNPLPEKKRLKLPRRQSADRLTRIAEFGSFSRLSIDGSC
jgi:hypothetical protein